MLPGTSAGARLLIIHGPEMSFASLWDGTSLGSFLGSVRGELAKGSNVAKGSWPFGRSVGVAGLSATHCQAQEAGPGLSPQAFGRSSSVAGSL